MACRGGRFAQEVIQVLRYCVVKAPKPVQGGDDGQSGKPAFRKPSIKCTVSSTRLKYFAVNDWLILYQGSRRRARSTSPFAFSWRPICAYVMPKMYIPC